MLNQAHQNINDNYDYLFSQPQVNNISLRITYYLDYNRMRNSFGTSSFAQKIKVNQDHHKNSNSRNKFGNAAIDIY
jgi:hypothetical protein